jgi:hypothetical protein
MKGFKVQGSMFKVKEGASGVTAMGSNGDGVRLLQIDYR